MTNVTTVLIDFGGVLAEEGFREGLREIGKRNGLDPEGFFRTAERLIFETGYLTGDAVEATFWEAVRAETGITEPDEDLRTEILCRFTLRTAMLIWVERLRKAGLRVVILSDQTNWLEEIDQQNDLYDRFDGVLNSYRYGKSKRDASLFVDACEELGVAPSSILFVDDNREHIERAASKGLQTLLFTSENAFAQQIAGVLGPAT